MKKALLILLIILSVFLFAETEEAGDEIAFLDLGVGARPLGMGGAFVAVADNADAPYWNAAGMVQLKRAEFTTMQTKLSTEADYYYASYAQPGDLSWGISWVQIKMKDIVETSPTLSGHDVVELGKFDYTADAAMLALAKKINNWLSLGICLKGISKKMGVADGNARGYSFTPSIFIKPSEDIALGLQIRDLNNIQEWDTGLKEKIPATLQLGISFRLRKELLLTWEAEKKQAANHSLFIKSGLEYILSDMLSIRLGNDRSRYTAGIGLAITNFSFDYAYVGKEDNGLGEESRISLGVKF